ncbi:MAG: DUF4892 domain-containing protein [Gammaproteobacteria bacterium]|nr:MAG: DUF4892 domain-containing protein [Gammaproteobacteria bacterium]
MSLRRLWISCGLWLACLISLSAQALEPFPYSKVLKEDTRTVADYRIVLSGVYPGRGEPRLDREQRASGEVSRQTLEITSDRSPREVFEHYRAEAEKEGFSLVFECHGRDCGDSATWSADIFARSELYGFMRDQHFFTAVNRDLTEVLMFYTIRRGNQKVYAHWERLRSVKPLADLKTSLSTTQVTLQGAELERLSLLEKKLAPLLEARGDQDTWILVSWAREPNRSAERNLRTSRQQAELVADLLRRRIGPDTDIRIHALGPWGPESLFAEEDRVISVHREGE